MIREDVKEAECMRAHGYPNFPDPTMSHGQVLLSAAGTHTRSQQFLAAVRTCS
jgi:hypothetical protein